MITRPPDPALTVEKLLGELGAFREDIARQPRWFAREKYVDRGRYDPFYILDWRREVTDSNVAIDGEHEPDDDLLGERLFATGRPGFRLKNLTRLPYESTAYWKEIGSGELLRRLARFETMYMENRLQPPGWLEDPLRGRRPHAIFEKQAFLYRIGSPEKFLVGRGPAMFAGASLAGALRGRVLAEETGLPLSGARVELWSAGRRIAFRTTDAAGRFWFSKVPGGRFRLRVPDYAARIESFTTEDFAPVSGAVDDANRILPDRAPVRFQADDGEIFQAPTDDRGEFRTELPANPDGRPYRLRIPDFMFTANASHKTAGLLAGTLRDIQGRSLPGQWVVLKRDGSELARQRTDSTGSFRFTDLEGGRYSLGVPGRRIYGRETPLASLEGRLRGANEPVRLELILNEEVLAHTESDDEGRFAFEAIPPGPYRLRADGVDLEEIP